MTTSPHNESSPLLKLLTRWPLSVTLPVLLLIFSSTIGIYSYYDGLDYAFQQARHEAIEKMRQLLTTKQATIEYLISKDHRERLQESIGIIGADQSIELALLVDDNGKVMAGLHMAQIGKTEEDILLAKDQRDLTQFSQSKATAIKTHTGVTLLSDDKQRVLGVFPIDLGQRRTGLIMAQMNLADGYAIYRYQTERRLLRFFAVVGTLALFTWGLFNLLLTRRVASLVTVTKRVAGGDWRARAEIAGADEIASLGHAFDHMTAQVADNYQRLAEQETQLRQVMGAAGMGSWRWQIATNRLQWSPTTYALFDIPTDSPVDYDKFLSFVHGDDKPRLLSAIDHALRQSDELDAEYRIVLPGGFIRWIATKGDLTRDESGAPLEMRGVIWDINVRKTAEEALFQQKERVEVTLHSIGDAVITTDQKGIVDYLNPIAEDLTGWRVEDAVGKPLNQIFHIINENTRLLAVNPVDKCLREGKIVALANHSVLISREGREISIEDSAAPIRNKQGEIIGVVLVFHDVSKARELTDKLAWQASHDNLTGLINRTDFESRLAQVIAATRANHEEHILLFLDLDQFKVVNDTYGHVAGDKLLKELAALMQSKMRSNDILGRLGGDEFGILLQHCHLEQGMRVADNLRRLIKEYRLTWENKSFDLSASIGMVNINATSGELEQVMSAADMSCYAAKESGRNRIHIFKADDVMLLKRYGEMQWISRINQAIDNNFFRLYRQSIKPVKAEHREEDHYEVLLRLLNEDGTIIAPGAFMPAAERYSLMPAIDRWVIDSYFAEYARNYAQLPSGKRQHFASINLSGASLNDDDFPDFVRQQFDKHKVPPQAICFEITETVAIGNLDKTQKLIHELKALGCRFSLDDFGVGLSSFGYLKTLPVDYLKIDGGFVKNMNNDTMDYAMVESINQIGHVMGMKTVAEYVENHEILAKLRIIGVDYAQGYGIAKPRPL
jgi:diguanylate cyclase (GGDEF)-like protein/PAS domain S-box-containing protein